MLFHSDPYQPLEQLAQQRAARTAEGPTSIPMDAYRQGDQLVVELDLPGVDPATVEITVERNVLSVEARRQRAAGADQWVVAERPQGSFARQIVLGDTLEGEAVQASYDNGVLRLAIPMARQARPRRIAVTTSGASGPGAFGPGGQASIDAEATPSGG